MKGYIATLITFFIVLAGYAQPVITYEDQSMNPGDFNETVFTSYADPGAGGENQVWDFSGQKILNDHHATIMAADTTPFRKDFPKANMAIKEHGNYFYFDVQPAHSSYQGYVKNENLVIKYDKGARKMRYPFQYGDQYTGDFTGKTVVSTIYGQYRVEGDGYGTLKLPGGKILNNVLRVKSTEDFVEQACNAVHARTEKYIWYHSDYRYPVYVMFYRKEAYTNREEPKVYRYGIMNKSLKNSQQATAIAKRGKKHSHRLMPNPFMEETQIHYTLKAPAHVRLEVFDMKGNQVQVLKDGKESAGSYQLSFKPAQSGIKPGSYLLKVVLGNQVNLEKLVYASE